MDALKFIEERQRMCKSYYDAEKGHSGCYERREDERMKDEKKKYRRWAVVYILLALLMAAVLALLMAAGVYKTLVGVLCMVAVAADMVFLVAGSTYLWREEKR